MTTALEVTRKASWFHHYAPTHWTLNLVNIFPHLTGPYTISKVKGGYTVTLDTVPVGRFATFEDAIVGAWENADAACGAQLFGDGYQYEYTARRVA